MKMKITLLILVFMGFSIDGNGQTAVPDSIYPSPDLVITDHSEWTKTHYPQRISEFKTNPLNTNDIVFLGNSLTELGGDWGIRFSSQIVKNRGIAGDVTEGVLQRLGEINYFKPSSVFLLIGINDLFANRTPEYVSANILKITRSINLNSPLTKIYVQTILPTSNPDLAPKIQATNDILKSSESSENYTIIDLHVLFANESDLMKPELTTDGVHLNQAGYQIWEEDLKNLFTPDPSSNLLKNSDLKAGDQNWNLTGTAYMFKTIDWSPAETILRSFGNNYWQWANQVVNGSITQTVFGLEDGEYTFSCQFAGAAPGLKAYSALIATDGNGIVTKKEFSMPAVWTKIDLPVNVTGGSCTVGFTIKDTLNSVFWFAASDFKFIKTNATHISQNVEEVPVYLIASPNPFINETTIRFTLPSACNLIKLEFLTIKGQLISRKYMRNVMAGVQYNYKFESDISGEQFLLVRLITNDKVFTCKLIQSEQ